MRIIGFIAFYAVLCAFLPIQATEGLSDSCLERESSELSFEEENQFNARLQLFINDTVVKETRNIQQTAYDDYETLADLYANRAESYLILNEDQQALEDFLMSYHCALNSSSEDQTILMFRALFGAFLVHIRAENMEEAQALFDDLETLLKQCACCECPKNPVVRSSFSMPLMTIASSSEPDWPILGSDRISRQECMDRVKAIKKSIDMLFDSIKRADVRVLATIMIDGLVKEANKCCMKGGLWKGCLQKLVNKLHYWQTLGLPSDLSYYTGVHFASLDDQSMDALPVLISNQIHLK